jgi:hypothetical protein
MAVKRFAVRRRENPPRETGFDRLCDTLNDILQFGLFFGLLAIGIYSCSAKAEPRMKRQLGRRLSVRSVVADQVICRFRNPWRSSHCGRGTC